MVRMIKRMSEAKPCKLSNSAKQYIKSFTIQSLEDDPNVDISDIAIFLAGDLQEQGLSSGSTSSLTNAIQQYIQEVL